MNTIHAILYKFSYLSKHLMGHLRIISLCPNTRYFLKSFTYTSKMYIILIWQRQYDELTGYIIVHHDNVGIYRRWQVPPRVQGNNSKTGCSILEFIETIVSASLSMLRYNATEMLLMFKMFS